MKKKTWSFGKLVSVFFGGLVGVIVLAVVVIKLLAPKPASQSPSAPQQASTPQKTETVSISAAPVQTQGMIGPDIVSVQLESAKNALREAKEDSKALEQKFANALAVRDQAWNGKEQAFNAQVLDLSKRVKALEDDRKLNPGVAVVGPEKHAAEEEQPATKPAPKTAYTPPKGYVVRAELGDRVWLFDGTNEISMLKTEAAPKPPVRTTKAAEAKTTGPAITASAVN